VSGHTTPLGVGVKARRWVLDFLDETGHVFEEQIVHVLLIHVAELQAELSPRHLANSSSKLFSFSQIFCV